MTDMETIVKLMSKYRSKSDMNVRPYQKVVNVTTINGVQTQSVARVDYASVVISSPMDSTEVRMYFDEDGSFSYVGATRNY